MPIKPVVLCRWLCSFKDNTPQQLLTLAPLLYPINQFINDNSNKRTDKYGGSVENRCRLTLEVLAALCTVYPAGCVGVRFSPASTFDDMHDSNPKETFTYIISQADKLVSEPQAVSFLLAGHTGRGCGMLRVRIWPFTQGLSYIHTVDPRIKGNDEGGDAATGLDATYWRSVSTQLSRRLG